LRAAVFSGPTLWSDPILCARDLLFLPPAKDGDVYRAARSDAPAIGIIDGQFETAPGIWHKEILFALSRGIPVFGAASMGALRAAELAPFGMLGVGRIFESIASGTLRDDDEVAVLHAGPELGFRPLSEAMVDIRATLESALAGGVVSKNTCRHIERIAKAMFFKDRHWEYVLRRAANTPLRKREIAAFSGWLPQNKVEQKREDARAMLAAMRMRIASGAQPFRPAFEFQRTCFWRSFVATQRRARA